MPVDLEVLARIIDQENYPANPATGGEGAENTALERENACRVEDPAPTRQTPAEPGTPPLAGDLPGGAGYLPGGVPGKDLSDKEGHKPRLEVGLPG